MMDERLEKNFIKEMCEELKRQLSDFELAKKKEEHNAKIVSDDGRRRWFGLRDCLKNYIEVINDSLSEPLLSYSDNESGNELSLRHELTDCDVQVTFDPASSVISYEGNKSKGKFRPRVHGDALVYEWDETTPSPGAARRIRNISFDDELPKPVPTERMSEIILRCVVMSAA